MLDAEHKHKVSSTLNASKSLKIPSLLVWPTMQEAGRQATPTEKIAPTTKGAGGAKSWNICDRGVAQDWLEYEGWGVWDATDKMLVKGT